MQVLGSTGSEGRPLPGAKRLPMRLLITRDALQDPLGQRLAAQGEVTAELPTDLQGAFDTIVVRRQQPVRLELEGDQGLFHLARGCPLACRFCSLLYLYRRRPYVELYSNREEILATVAEAATRHPQTRFIVGEATDMLAHPLLTEALLDAVDRLAGHARLEFLTRRAEVDPLLARDPRGTVTFGISLTTRTELEPGASPPAERIRALARAQTHGYGTLLNLAPLFPGDDLRPLLDLVDVQPDRIECEAHWQKSVEFEVMEALGWPLNRAHLAERQGLWTTRLPEGLPGELRRRFPRAALHFQPPPEPEWRPTLLK